MWIESNARRVCVWVWPGAGRWRRRSEGRGAKKEKQPQRRATEAVTEGGERASTYKRYEVYGVAYPMSLGRRLLPGRSRLDRQSSAEQSRKENVVFWRRDTVSRSLGRPALGAARLNQSRQSGREITSRVG